MWRDSANPINTNYLKLNEMKRISILALCAFFTIVSCISRETYTSNESVSFLARYNHLPTKATIFPVGNKVKIFAYKAGDSPSTANMTPGTPLEATSTGGGVLNPSNPLYLPKGSYDFYSVSKNSSNAEGISFTSGVSEPLNNGTDYLWAKHASVNEGGVVTFNYFHKATAIEIEIKEGSGVSSVTVNYIKITPSKPQAQTVMELSTGEITPSTATDVLSIMNHSGNKGSIIMLPLITKNIDIEISINALIGGVSVENKIYTATLPSQAYSGGTLYTISLSVTATSLTFSGTQIEDWTTQSISGITLTEQ